MRRANQLRKIAEHKRASAGLLTALSPFLDLIEQSKAPTVGSTECAAAVEALPEETRAQIRRRLSSALTDKRTEEIVRGVVGMTVERYAEALLEERADEMKLAIRAMIASEFDSVVRIACQAVLDAAIGRVRAELIK